MGKRLQCSGCTWRLYCVNVYSVYLAVIEEHSQTSGSVHLNNGKSRAKNSKLGISAVTVAQ